MADWYEVTGWPGQSAPGDSAPGRSEFVALQQSFAKMPILTSRANRPVFVNSTGTGLVSITAAVARELLGVEIGVDVQAFSEVLANTTASFTTTLEGQIETNRTDIVELKSDVLELQQQVASLQLQLNSLGIQTVALGNISGSVQLDLTQGSMFGGAATGNLTLTIVGASASFGGEFSLTLTTTDSYSITAITMASHTVYVGLGDTVEGEIVLAANSRTVLGFIYDLDSLQAFVRTVEALS
jgi:hypothetical protein